MTDSVARVLIVVLWSASACSSQSPTGAESGSARRPGPEALGPIDAGSLLQIERRLPGPGWERAGEIALPTLQPWAETAGHARLVVKPLQAPDGSTLEHMLLYEAFSAKRREYWSRVLVANGAIVEKSGQQGAERFLRERGFPRKRIERGLLYEVLIVHGVITLAWVAPPSDSGWDVLDRGDTTGGRKPVELVYDATGATMTILRGVEYNPHEKQRVDRFVIRFDSDARMTITSAREQVDGSWKPIPTAP